jgi:hypothetical protein
MGWADHAVAARSKLHGVALRQSRDVAIGKIESGQLCTVAPLGEHVLATGDIVLCRDPGRALPGWQQPRRHQRLDLEAADLRQADRDRCLSYADTISLR